MAAEAQRYRGRFHDFNSKVETVDDYHRRFQIFCNLNRAQFGEENGEDAELLDQRRLLFLSCLPPEVASPLARQVANLETESIANLVTALRSLVHGDETELGCRVKLSHMRQQPGQSISSFIAAINELSSRCGFDANTKETTLKDCLVFGPRNADIRRKLLKKRPTSTYEQLCVFAASQDSVDKDLAVVEQLRENKVYRVEQFDVSQHPPRFGINAAPGPGRQFVPQPNQRFPMPRSSAPTYPRGPRPQQRGGPAQAAAGPGAGAGQPPPALQCPHAQSALEGMWAEASRQRPAHPGGYQRQPYPGAFNQRQPYPGAFNQRQSYPGAFNQRQSYPGAFYQRQPYSGAYQQQPYSGAHSYTEAYQQPYYEASHQPYPEAYQQQPYPGAFQQGSGQGRFFSPRPGPRPPQQSLFLCNGCGKIHQPGMCPASRQKCYQCRQRGHLAEAHYVNQAAVQCVSESEVGSEAQFNGGTAAIQWQEEAAVLDPGMHEFYAQSSASAQSVDINDSGTTDEAYVMNYFQDLHLDDSVANSQYQDYSYYNCNFVQDLSPSPTDLLFLSDSVDDIQYSQKLAVEIELLQQTECKKTFEGNALSDSQHSECSEPPVALNFPTSTAVPQINVLQVINKLEQVHDPLVVEVKCDSQSVLMEVDSGAGITLFHSLDFFELLPQAHLKSCLSRVKSVSGHVLEVEGKSEVKVCLPNGKQHNLPIVVCRSPYQFTPLFGRNWLDEVVPEWRSIFSSTMPVSRINKLSVDCKPTHPEVAKLKLLFPNIFIKDGTVTIKGFKASVVLKENAVPQFHKPYPVAYSMVDEVTNQLRQAIQNGRYIPVSFSEWASPTWPIAKPDGSPRLVVDYKKTVNPHINIDRWPLPRPDDIFVGLSGCKTFVVLDLSEAYKQLELDEHSQKVLTINTHLGLLQPTTMQFGVASAPGDFQQIMEVLIAKVKQRLFKQRQGSSAVIYAYLDDYVLGAKSESDLAELLKILCEVLSEHNIRINEKKCQFFVDEIVYLGHVINARGISTLDKRVQPIVNARPPTNVTELRSYLGMINFYRRFVPNLSEYLRPLQALVSPATAWEWSPECQSAFELSKQQLVSNSVLTHYDPSLPIVISADASQYGIGGYLAHRTEEGELPVMFFSCTLTPTQQRYSQIEKEALAITVALQKFHKYIWGRHFILITDSMPLKAMFSPAKGLPLIAAVRLQRWAMLLNAYMYRIEYRKSGDMGASDMLSRLPLAETPMEFIGSFSIPYNLPLNFEMVAVETGKDPILNQVLYFVIKGWPEHMKDAGLKPYFDLRYSLSTYNNCVVFGERVCIPPVLQTKVLELLHEGHPGETRMKMLAKLHVWWPDINGEITKLLAHCEPCALVNFRPATNVTVSWPETMAPWTRLHLDFFFWNNNVFFLLVDSHTKWVEVWPMATTVAQAVIDKLAWCFSTFGYPLEVVSDNGPPFNSFKFLDFCSLNSIVVTKSPPYHPQSNGLAERWVQTVKRSLKKLMLQNSKLSLEEKLSQILTVLRNTPCTSTGLRPSELMFRFSPRTSLSVLRPPAVSDRSTYVPRSAQFNVGDSVLVKIGDKEVAVGTVLQVSGPTTYMVQVDGEVKFVHVNQMRISKLPASEAIPSASSVSTVPRVPVTPAPSFSHFQIPMPPIVQRPVRPAILVTPPPPPPLYVPPIQPNNNGNGEPPPLRRSGRVRRAPDFLRY